MELTITSKEEQSLFKRTAITATIIAEAATPSTNTVREALAHHLKTDANHISVRSIGGDFGSGTVTITAMAYNDKSSLDLLEQTAKPKKKGEEKPAEA